MSADRNNNKVSSQTLSSDMLLATCVLHGCMQEAEAERRDREEEHRLAHVAMTRAKERLYLTVLKTETKTRHWGVKPAQSAQFLESLSIMESNPAALRVRETLLSCPAMTPTVLTRAALMSDNQLQGVVGCDMQRRDMGGCPWHPERAEEGQKPAIDVAGSASRSSAVEAKVLRPGLNEEQERAAFSPVDKPLLIIAGGSI